MDTREQILGNVRKNHPANRELPAIPAFHREPESLVSVFERSLKYMAGVFVGSPPPDFSAYVHKAFPQAKNICSAVPEYSGNKTPEDYRNWADATDIDVTIVRSPLGVAETGSVLLTESELRVNTIGFLAHDIVILLDPKNIIENIHDAYQHPAFRESKYAVLMTGPSGSADIGGKTVHPAQGVMTLTVIMWPVGHKPK
ncbi:MAG: LUD domain-containing protein [Verrucomicrobia bacterium]|nr:LUD domain-containing protein [Verrucomicrobiota bacterium]